ncbi:MAG TPA: nicotinate-nucleotide--dimethylbenzimidazole phosphoribosyltransferase [Clostridia bacterium]|nr:nicotinate-nucleotide--dimethylbenzimidazole phosphoribosyltransferase [Clostridia bacterium]
MMYVETVRKRIGPLHEDAMRAARRRLDSLTKPRGSLGVLEDLAVTLAGIVGEPIPKLSHKVVLVMAGDHGVARDGLTGYPQEVTAQMVRNFLRGGAAINVLSRLAGAEVRVVDVGVACDMEEPGLISMKIVRGTENIAKAPAMSETDASRCILAGAIAARDACEAGADVIAVGEMGIGNTTPSTAILATFSGMPVEAITGRGAGLDDEGLARKIEIIRKALDLHRPDPRDAMDVLSKLGGAEIAAMTGAILEGAARRRPVVLDGFICGVAGLVACRLVPASRDYMIASHLSREPGHRLVLELLGKKPLFNLDMRLGEGTGAALALHLLEASTRIMREMATFDEAGVSQGTVHSGTDIP